MQRMKIAHQKAREHFYRATDRVHRNFNKRAAPTPIRLGDKVYLYDPALKVGLSAKLAKKWTGPYRVIELEEVNAVIKEVYGRKTQKVHVNRLKRCYSEADPIPIVTEQGSVGSAETECVTPFIPMIPPDAPVDTLEPRTSVANEILRREEPNKTTETNPNELSNLINQTQESDLSTGPAQLEQSLAQPSTTRSQSTPAPSPRPSPEPQTRYGLRSRGPAPEFPWISRNRV